MKTCTYCHQNKPLSEFYALRKKYKASRCKTCVKYIATIYNKTNKKERALTNTKYKQTHAGEIKASHKSYKEQHRERNNELQQLRRIKQRLLNPPPKRKRTAIEYKKLAKRCRRMVERCLEIKNEAKISRTFEILKYKPSDLKQRIETQFKQGMSWNNYGDWHIDHIKPLCKFKIDTTIYTMNALCNLQPLWAEENLKKGGDF